jgi:hypothetical protein
MRSKKHTRKIKTKTKTKTKRTYKKGGNTSSDLAVIRMEEGLRNKNKPDTYIIDIKSSSHSSSSIPPPPPLPLSDSDSFKSVIEEIVPLPRKKAKRIYITKKASPINKLLLTLMTLKEWFTIIDPSLQKPFLCSLRFPHL